jgi:hypothetical protein
MRAVNPLGTGVSASVRNRIGAGDGAEGAEEGSRRGRASALVAAFFKSPGPRRADMQLNPSYDALQFDETML